MSQARPTRQESAPSEIEKVGFLSLPGSYPEGTGAVSIIETHHAWVFLTDTYAFKMKKPSRIGQPDSSALSARRLLCLEELRLNRRLARKTYLGVIPLVVTPGGNLELEGDGAPVEWLVKMRRLPRDRFLDVAGRSGGVTEADIDMLMRKLHRFHRAAATCSVGRSYPERLHDELAAHGNELTKARFGYAPTLTKPVLAGQEDYIEANIELLDGRQRDGYVSENHGDLRPEHVCLLPGREPEIIDCLEFDPDLRCLDRVEEIAFFGLECRALEMTWIERHCIEWYRTHSDDAVPASLWSFYAARRATMRAMLCAWHTLDTGPVDHWLERGRTYLEFASGYLGMALAD